MNSAANTYTVIDLNDVRPQFEHPREVDERPRIISALEYVTADGHNSLFEILAAIQNELGEDGRDIAEAWVQTQDNSRAKEFNYVWRSCTQGKGYSIGTLFHLARENGWRDDVQAKTLTRKEAEARKLSKEEAVRLNLEAQELNRARAKKRAAAILEAALPASDNPYLLRKQVSPGHGLKSIHADAVEKILGYRVSNDHGELQGELLVVPCYRDFAPEPATLQLIDSEGRKVFLSGGGVGVYPSVPFPAPGTSGLTFYIAEGAATCLSVSQAMQGGVGISAGNNGQLSKTALAIRTRYPDAHIILLADLKKDTGEPDPLAVEAARAVSGTLAVPDFGPGWTAGMGNDFNDLFVLKGMDAVRRCIEVGQGASAGKPRLRALRRDDLMEAPDIEWAIKSVMPSRGLGMVFGLSQVGKSFTTVDMAEALAEGRDWFGCRVKQRSVVYACLEGQHGFKRRVQAWEAHHGRRYSSNVIFCPDPFDLRSVQDTTDLIELARREAGPGAVVIVDTLNRAAPGMEENGSVDYGLILASAARIEQAVEGFVCFVGHPGKDATKGIRGHSSMFAGLDMVLEVEEVNKAELSFAWTIRKAKDGQDGIKRHFKREVVELFEDADGDLVTSCVIVPDPEMDQDVKTAKTANISRTNRERFEGFRQAAMEHGTLDDAGQFIGLDKEQWRTHFFEHSPAPNNPAKRSAHNTATKELKKVGLIYERADGLFQFDGPGAETQAETIRAAIEERSRGKNQGQTEGRRERRDPKKSEDSSPAKGREAKRREDPPLRDLRSSHESGQLSVDFEGEEKPDRRKTEPSSPGTKIDPREHGMWSDSVIHVQGDCAGYPQLCERCVHHSEDGCAGIVAPF